MRGSEPSGPTAGSAEETASRGCVTLILQRFPHIRSVSLDLLHRLDDFRDLCEEYEACTRACERLEHSNAGETLHREYVALRLRLESELLRYVEEHSGDGCGDGGPPA